MGLGVGLGDADALEQAEVEIAVVGAAQVSELAGEVLATSRALSRSTAVGACGSQAASAGMPASTKWYMSLAQSTSRSLGSSPRASRVKNRPAPGCSCLNAMHSSRNSRAPRICSGMHRF